MKPAYNDLPIPYYSKTAEMSAFLKNAYWENDVWIASDPFFDEYSTDTADRPNWRRIDFLEYPEIFRVELKYFHARMISGRVMQISTICSNHKRSLRLLMRFLNEFYPEIRSFSDIKGNEAETQWIEHLESEGYKTSRFRTVINQICSFFSDFYDDRDEFEKDIWDCRKIPNITLDTASYKINFTSVPLAFRHVAQRYIKLRIATSSISHIRRELNSITRFLDFIAAKEPGWTNLNKLTRRHVEDFLAFYLGEYRIKTDCVIERLTDIRCFLQHIQQLDCLDTPLIPALPLFYSEDIMRPLEFPTVNLAYSHPTSDCDKKSEMEAFLRNTYWDNDIWDIKNRFFDKYSTASDNSCAVRRIVFSDFTDLFRLEVKYYYAFRISNKTLHPRTCNGYQYTIRQFLRFSSVAYPNIHSFSDTVIKQVIVQWLEQLEHEGYKKPKDGTRSILNQLCAFFSDFYDDRDEFEKDVWDCRKIPGIDIPVNATKHKLNFMSVPLAFRKLAQRYMKLRITTNSVQYAHKELDGIALFLQFIASKEPNWTSLESLTRRHIEDFIVSYLGEHVVKKRSVTERLIYVRTFLRRIQQFSYPDAPLVSSLSLMYDEDIPRPMELPPMEARIKYIPEGVMIQLKEHLVHLDPPEYIPVVILLMASGWRGSDVLGLKYDTCLEHTEQGWYLQGDIPKTRTIAHRVPITDEVKTVVESVALIAKAKSTAENNPRRLLFNRYSGLRIGRAPYNRSITEALNRLAEDYSINDDYGNLYHFGLHAFRHAKGVELINNGMKLEHVQKWMAHASPEMTLVYAKVLDTTLRKSWEQAVKNGIFRMTDSGRIKKIDISNIDNEDLIEWEYIRYNLDAVRMPLGFCMKPKKQNCFTQLNPCLTCRNLCTTPDFLPQYEAEILETKTLIERGKTQGREVWVEKNRHLLERYEEIVAVLKTGHTRHIAGKKGREYIGEERTNAKQ
jgi:integrase